MSKPMNPEIEKFISWCYKEIKENDMVSLGPFRFVAEHKSQKSSTVTPAGWIARMAGMLSKKESRGVTGVEVAENFNALIENNEIDRFIVRSNKRIAEDAIKDLMNKKQDII